MADYRSKNEMERLTTYKQKRACANYRKSIRSHPIWAWTYGSVERNKIICYGSK